MNIYPIVWLAITAAVYGGFGFAVIYFAVRFAIRHELGKRA